MNNQAGIRLAVIDTDSAFLTVLGKRLEGAGWEHRVLAGSVPVEELVAMKLNALLVDLSVLGPQGWEFLEKVCGAIPGLGVLVCTSQSTVAQRVRGLRLGADDWIAQAVPPRGGHGAHRGRGPPPQARGRPRGRRAAGLRRARDPRRPVPGVRQRPEHRPDAPRVRAAAAARRGARPGDRARGDLPEGLGLRDGSRRPLGRRLRPQAPPEAPAPLGQLALHPHPLRDRLPVRPGGRSAACGEATAIDVPGPAEEPARTPSSPSRTASSG